MKKYQILFSIVLLLGALLSCQKTETPQSQAVKFTLNALGSTLKEATVTTLNLTTKTERSEDVVITEGGFSLTLSAGLYNLSFAAKDAQGDYRAYLESVNVTGSEQTLHLAPFKVDRKLDFVIDEIFYTGTVYPDTKKSYTGDAYFKITNNSDMILYADGLTIAESAFVTATKRDFTPNIMAEAVTVHAIYTVPGTGKEHPIKPGESFIISDKAINHKVEGHLNSFDLSASAFEWYDESTNGFKDTDNPSVSNLDKIYCYTQSVWIPSRQGNRSYLLARMGVSKDIYLKDFKYDYSYVFNDRVIKQSDYKIPNSWVLDAVTLASTDGWQWNCVDQSLDAGYTYCGVNSKDPERYGKCVRRKRAVDSNSGLVVLKDTNNSTVDFDRDVIPFS